MLRYIALAGTVGIIATAAAAPFLHTSDDADGDVELARQFNARLRQTLTREFSAGGPLQALGVCGDSAQAIAQEFSALHGVRIYRTSNKVRNSANAPDSIDIPVVRLMSRMVSLAGSAEPMSASDPKKKVKRTYMPVIVQAPLCTSCHGSPQDMQPEVVAELRRRYPDDKATGYQDGDFRGVVVVERPLK